MRLIYTLIFILSATTSLICQLDDIHKNASCPGYLTDALENLANDTDYIPGNGTPEGDEELTIQYRVYVVQHSISDPRNYDQTHEEAIEDMENVMSSVFSNIKTPWIGGDNSNPNNYDLITDARIRFQRIGCIQYIQDINEYDNLSNGNWDNFPEVAEWKDDALNVFFVNESTSAIDGKAVQGTNCKVGVFLNAYKKLNNPYRGESVGKTFGHEIGHVLGLDHTWNTKGQFADTYNTSTFTFCNPTNNDDPECTSNMMSYNPKQDHISPLQAGHMRYNLVTLSSYMLADETESGTIEITTNTTWDEDKLFNKDVRVKNGATLTVESCVSFTENTTLFVDKGCKLVLNGGSLATRFAPDRSHRREQWYGVKAAGDPTLPQTETNQATVITQQHPTTGRRASISYAEKGIATEEVRNVNTDGGALVYCDDTDFYNNKWDLFITDTPDYVDHLSVINNCNFEADHKMNFFVNGTLREHIFVSNSLFIEILNSTFSNDKVNNPTSIGIRSNESILVIENCSYDGYRRAILLDTEPDGNNNNKGKILACSFSNNSIGLEILNISKTQVEINDNNFLIGGYPTLRSNYPNDGNHGIYLNNSQIEVSSGNIFEDQDFIPGGENPEGKYDSDTPTYGVLVRNSYYIGQPITQFNQTEVTESVFIDLDVAVESVGKNSYGVQFPGFDQFGFKLHCNNFIDCDYSLKVKDDGSTAGGIATNQFDTNMASGNSFETHTTGQDNSISNSTSSVIEYYYLNIPSHVPNVVGGGVNTIITQNELCPSGIPEPPKGKSLAAETKKASIFLAQEKFVDQKFVNLFPNPVGSEVLRVTNADLVEYYDIYSAHGKFILQGTKFQATKGIDMRSISSGIYFIHIRLTDGRTVNKKIIRH